jgi:hypothetical protein
MATIEFIQKRIAGAEQNITKLTNKLSRIEAAEATGWEVNPYYYDESDKRSTLRELAAARDMLARYQQQLTEAQEKAASRNVTAILDFLGLWKARCMDFYGKGLHDVYVDMEQIRVMERRRGEMRRDDPARADLDKLIRERRLKHYRERHGFYETREETRNGRKYTSSVKVADGAWEYVNHYVGKSLEESMEKVKKDLDQEADRKYDFIIDRTCAIVGEITDASGLKIGAKQDLNGIIVGTKGQAKVSTIGAGGYNIQCFHFRTLINRI